MKIALLMFAALSLAFDAVGVPSVAAADAHLGIMTSADGAVTIVQCPDYGRYCSVMDDGDGALRRAAAGEMFVVTDIPALDAAAIGAAARAAVPAGGLLIAVRSTAPRGAIVSIVAVMPLPAGRVAFGWATSVGPEPAAAARTSSIRVYTIGYANRDVRWSRAAKPQRAIERAVRAAAAEAAAYADGPGHEEIWWRSGAVARNLGPARAEEVFMW